MLSAVSPRSLKVYCLVTLLLLAFALGLWALFIKGWHIKLERIFLICMLMAGTAWLCILPPLSAPDEMTHYVTAYKWSNQMLFQKGEDEAGRILMRVEDADAPFDLLSSQTEETYQAFFDHLLEPCRDSTVVSFNYKAAKSGPLPYLPQAVGITLGRVFHMGWAGTMLLGRMGNLLFFAFCMYQALRLMPFGKIILFMVCMLPMTQELAASMSYDVTLLSLTALFVAVCFRDIYIKESMGKRDVMVLALLLMALVPCKIIYFPIVGLCLLIPREKFAQKRFYILSMAAIFFLSAFSLVLNNMGVLSEYAPGGENYIGWADAPGYTVDMLLANPLHTLDVLFHTVRTKTGFYWETMIGKWLGAMNVPLDNLYILGFSGLLFIASLKREEAGIMTTGKRVWCLVLCAGISVLIFLSLFLGWTPVGATYVQGIQGRYFLPILPLFLLTLQNRTLYISGSWGLYGEDGWKLALAALLLNASALHAAAAMLVERTVV